MADEKSPPGGNPRWVVLLNKTLKGPLTELEVRSLLDQGLLRANDPAFLVTEGDDGRASDWKLLWQFPQFDRRAKEPAPQAKQEAKAEKSESPAASDRRSQLSPEEAKKRILENLPPDIASINPEDLLGHTTRAPMKLDPTEAGNLEPEPVSAVPSELLMKASGGLRWALAALALAGFSYGLLYWIHSRGTGDNTSNQQASHTSKNRELAPIGAAPSPRSSGGARPSEGASPRSLAARGEPPHAEPVHPPEARDSEPSVAAETPLDTAAENERRDREDEERRNVEENDKREAEEGAEGPDGQQNPAAQNGNPRANAPQQQERREPNDGSGEVVNAEPGPGDTGAAEPQQPQPPPDENQPPE